MTLYVGRTYHDGDVSIGPADLEAARQAARSTDVAPNVERWSARAQMSEDVCYFAIRWRGELVGQILLHDLDRASGEALVAYHFFEPRRRGLGIGTSALRLLQTYVAERGDLARLFLITSCDNRASRRAAEKAGFAHVGAPREDPTGILMRWDSPR